MTTTAKERGSCQYGNTRLRYVIYRRAGRRSATISVGPEGTVAVVAPIGATQDAIRDALRRRAKWVLTQLDEARQLTEIPPRHFVSGETIRYAGRQYRLIVRVEAACASPEVNLRGGDLVAVVPSMGRQRRSVVRDALIQWMRTTSHPRIDRLFRRRLLAFGLVNVPMQIRELGKRWGSCTRGPRVLLNWRVAILPTRLARYVIDHELTHARHPNHSPAFWKALATMCPAFDQHETQLRSAERSLWR